jgi:PTH1 family peptidyl-tRNA hydrolase
MATANYYPLLICSLGNPGAQYAKTLHSAGHTILSIIRERGQYHPFQKGMSGQYATPDTTRFRYTLTGFKKDGSRGLTAGEDDFTLWQSTKFMNVSGPAVHSAWRTFAAQQRARGLEGRLVVVHDELEAQLGKVSIKDGTASPRGHNGLKSVQASMGGNKWWRVGVGIGRPESRDPNVVSKYVLRKMTYTEEKAMDSATFDVLAALRKISDGSA